MGNQTVVLAECVTNVSSSIVRASVRKYSRKIQQVVTCVAKTLPLQVMSSILVNTEHFVRAKMGHMIWKFQTKI